MWDLWWKERYWGRLYSRTSISPANHSTDCSTLIIIREWYNRPVLASEIVDSVPLHPPPPKKRKVPPVVLSCIELIRKEVEMFKYQT
jgi:hypothetical protein